MTDTLSITGTIKVTEGTTDIISRALSVSENISEWTQQNLSLAASAADTAINFGGVGSDVPLIILKATYVNTGYLTAKVNGNTDTVPFGKLLVLGGSGSNGVDSITLSNPDADNAVEVEVFIGK